MRIADPTATNALQLQMPTSREFLSWFFGRERAREKERMSRRERDKA